VNEVSEITRGLKALARESNVPVVALSQLSRAIEQRPNHEPLLSDLRESGSIEQDADIVMFLAREDKRYTEEEWKQATFKGPKEGQPYPRGIVDVIIAKHRNGPTGRTQLRFFDNSTKFGSLERRRDPSA
jgi:replicative DNA helicase